MNWIPSLKDVTLTKKRVLLRVDYNVPLEYVSINQKNVTRITDTSRIDATISTIQAILDKNPTRLIIVSHLGRPDGSPNLKYSLKPVALYLQEKLDRQVILFDGSSYSFPPESEENSCVYIMENVRFHPEEEMSYIKNPEKVGAFRNFLSSMCDTFVNDAFGCLHRAHSSIVGVNAPQKAAGILVERELQYIGPIAFNQDQRISLLILGGAKVSDKIALISSLVPRTDRIYIGGAMVLTFMSVYNPNFHLGSSRIEPGCDSHVNNIISAIKDNGTRLFLPTDFKIADSLDDPVRMDTISIHDEFGIPDQMMALDIGPSSIVELDKLVRETPDGGIVLWNGPMGVFEKDPFSAGTRGLVSALSGSTPRITSIVGGGDSASAVNLFGDVSKMSHVSTGGGATLELLEGKILPGLSFLQS